MILLLAALAAVQVPAEPPAVPAKILSGIITVADYPPAALKRGAEGTTKVWFVVTTEGRATDCRVVQSSGHADLDAVVCRLATGRMRFTPALDAKGNARPMSAVMPVRWMADL